MKWSLDSPLMRFLAKIADLIILNLLWMAYSLPLVTIGASTTALYTVMLKIVKEEDIYITKVFFDAFRKNFKQSTIIWGILLFWGILFGIDMRLEMTSKTAAPSRLQLVFLGLEVLLAGIAVYASALQARYQNTVKNTLRNSVVLAILKLPYTLLMVLVPVVPALLMLADIRIMYWGIFFWLLIGVALTVRIHCILLWKVFDMLDRIAGNRQEEK